MAKRSRDSSPIDPPHETLAIREAIKRFLDQKDQGGTRLGGHKFGVYAFYDHDGEPIYVGQTFEGLGARIGRHLTNQRTDAVAMNVLDPFEVAEIEVWPISDPSSKDSRQLLDDLEFTVFQKVLAESRFGAVLNEKDMPKGALVELPNSVRGSIVPPELIDKRKHPDVRIARRAMTIAALARVISERKVSRGLRRTLQTQARRLEALATDRLRDFDGTLDGDQDSTEA